MNTLIKYKLIILLAMAVVTTGCITTTVSPAFSKSGGQVQIGLGGIKRNTNGKTLTAADVTATITDSSNTTYDAKVVGLYRAYGDHTSLYARETLDRGHVFWGNLEPYEGMWWATVQLVAPGGNTPLPLATGTARIRINSADLINTGWQYEGDLQNFTVEILSGTSLPTNDETFQFSAYRHERVLIINPDTLAGVSVIGGFQVTLTFNTSAIGGATQVFPRVVPYSHDPNINVIQSTVDNGNGTQTLTAFVTNPQGFVPDSTSGGAWVVGSSTFGDLQFAVVMSDLFGLADGWEVNYSLDPAESYYIDGNGDVIPAVIPVLGRSF